MCVDGSTSVAAQELHRQFGSDRGVEAHLNGAVHYSVLNAIRHGTGGVSRNMENRFRMAAGMKPLAAFVKLEVPPGCEAKVVRPRKPSTKKRVPRYSVPTGGREAGIYLVSRMSAVELDELVAAIVASA